MNEQQLHQLAKEAVSRYATEKVALNDAATDIATRENLSSEHVKRLVEAVNTQAFKEQFDGATPESADRMVEFETADPRTVLNRMLSNAKDDLSDPHADCGPSDMDAPLPNTRRSDTSDEPPPKTASAELHERPAKAHVLVARMRKTAEDLHIQKLGERNTFLDTTKDLLNCFRRSGGPSFEAFEKDAFYHHGTEAAAYLLTLRQSLGKPTATYDYGDATKVARVIETDTREMKLLKSALSSYNTIAKHAAAIANVEQKIAQLTKT